MPGKTDSTGSPKGSPFDWGGGRIDAIANLQREVLEAYEQASRAWVTRVQSEVELWSGLATKLTTTRSVPEAMQAYQHCISQRMQMAAEDGRRLSEDCQKVMQKITTSLTNGSPAASS
jgi:16S rRNA U1498 N3-methylase RsmE